VNRVSGTHRLDLEPSSFPCMQGVVKTPRAAVHVASSPASVLGNRPPAFRRRQLVGCVQRVEAVAGELVDVDSDGAALAASSSGSRTPKIGRVTA
jgi:hypothetical protein